MKQRFMAGPVRIHIFINPRFIREKEGITMPKLQEMLAERRSDPRFEIELPRELYSDNWVMVEGRALDLNNLMRSFGWEAIEVVSDALRAQEQELDYHEMEIEDDRGFYMDEEGGANWIVGAIYQQMEQVKASWKVLHRWGHNHQLGNIGVTALPPKPPRRPRQTRPERLVVQTLPLTETIPAYNASKEEVARWRLEQVTPLGPEAPLVRA
jgi:hypothetical protein